MFKFFRNNNKESKTTNKNIGALWEKEGKSEEHLGEPYLSGTINKENVLVFKVPRIEHYMNEFAPDWAIFVRNDNTERGIEQCGHLNIDDVDGKIEEIELETTVKIIDNNDFNKKILQNIKRFTGVFKDIEIVAIRNVNKINNQPEWKIFESDIQDKIEKQNSPIIDKKELKKIGFISIEQYENRKLIHGQIGSIPILLTEIQAIPGVKNIVYKFEQKNKNFAEAGYITISSLDEEVIGFDGVFEDRIITLFQKIKDSNSFLLVFELNKELIQDGFVKIQFDTKTEKAYQSKNIQEKEI